MNNTIYQEIKEGILLLDYKPGEVFSMRDLAEKFGVSVTPIREALIRLEVEGLVHMAPKSQARVTEVSLQDLKDVFEVRLFLAEQIGSLAAQRVTAEEIATFEKVLARMKKERDRRMLTQLDSEFHELVNQATKNKVLAKVAGMLRNRVVRLWFFIRDDDDNYWPMVVDGRERFLEALREGDPALGKEILRDHVLLFVEQLKKTMISEVPQMDP
jgi:DNA-binding GntR family transcriptional regulator